MRILPTISSRALLVVSVLITGCSESNDKKDVATGDQANGSGENKSKAVGDTASVSLPVLPISLAAATGKTAATIHETEECPFLSDEVPLSVKSPKPLVRSRVSNEGCTWSGMGFVVELKIEATDSAKPFAERHYNMDKKTAVKKLAGPGQDAVLLSHTTWGRPIAYAMGFKQKDKSIFIKMTGLKTDEATLSAIAKEVATRLPTAKSVEAQFRETKPAFDHCSVLNDDSAKALFGAPVDAAVSKNGYAGGCTYKVMVKTAQGYTTLELSTYISPAGKVTPEALVGQAGSAMAKGYDLPVVKKSETNKFATYYSHTAFVQGAMVQVQASDSEMKERSAEVKTVLANVLSRLKSP